MNQHIETILHKAPQPKAPGGLAEKLRADIRLPSSAEDPQAVAAVPWLRRWLPVLSFSALLLACLVAIAVQANVLAELRRQNRELQITGGEPEQQTAAGRASQKGETEQLRLEQLRKDVAEVERLRQEIAGLRAASQELTTLRAENQRLRAAVQAAAGPGGNGAEQDPFAVAKAKAESVTCISNLKQVGLAARMWSNDHGDVLPPDILAMKNELNSPKILVCPSDSGKTRASSWSEYGAANLTYEFLAFGVSEMEPPYTIMTRCPIHDHIGLLDGSVQSGGWKRAVQKDGRWILENNASRR